MNLEREIGSYVVMLGGLILPTRYMIIALGVRSNPFRANQSSAGTNTHLHREDNGLRPVEAKWKLEITITNVVWLVSAIMTIPYYW